MIDLSGHVRVGDQIRDETWTIEQHLSASQLLRSKLNTLTSGFVGAGNLTMNPEYLAFSDGCLFHIKGQHFERRFACLVFDSKGLIFRRMSLDPEHTPSGMGISGPALVENGLPASRNDIVQMAGKGLFYDLRHIIQFPVLDWPKGKADYLHINVGLSHFWKAGSLQVEVVRSALRGEPIRIDLSAYSKPLSRYGHPIGIDTLRSTITHQGYREVDVARDLGEFSIRENCLTIC